MKIVLDLQILQTESRNRDIGRYAFSLTRTMICEGKQHEFLIVLNQAFPDTIDNIKKMFSDLLPAENVKIFRTPAVSYELNADNLRLHLITEMIREQFIQQLQPDWVYVPNPFEFVDNSVTSIGRFAHIPTAVSVFDLIPYLHQNYFLNDPVKKSHYMRRFDYLRQAGLLLAVSENTRLAAIDYLGLPGEQVINISMGVDACFQKQVLRPEVVRQIREKYTLGHQFILYSGEINSEKNIEGLLEAFALLPPKLRSEHQLLICGDMPDEDRQRLSALASRLGLAKEAAILATCHNLEEKIALYSLCKLFVFPSLFPGFSSSILEALSCGAPVIASKTSSNHEIAGLEEALFDPISVKSISQKLHQALVDERFYHHLNAHEQAHARKFSWNTTARRALEAMETLHASKQEHKSICSISRAEVSNKPRLAYLSPLPPEKSGIADYSAELLPALARYYNIELITDLEKTGNPWLDSNLKRLSLKEFQRRAPEYERILYHFGNSEFHSHMFSLLSQYPGTVVLHDFFLSHSLLNLESLTSEKQFRQSLFTSHGYPALWFWQTSGNEETAWKYPCCLEVLQNAQGVLVHSNYALQLAKQFFSPDNEQYMKQIPFLRKMPEQNNREISRKALGIPEQAFLVCSFGFLSPHKLNEKLLNAWLVSELGKDKNCFLVFVGDGYGSKYELSLAKKIKDLGTNRRVTITGYVNAQQYRHYLAAADIAVQLRTRSRGESPASLFDCLTYGLPAVVNAHGSMAEFSEDMVDKIQDTFTDPELVKKLEELYHSPVRRSALKQKAMDYVKTNLAPERIAGIYFDAIESFARNHPLAVRNRLLLEIVELPSTKTPDNRQTVEIAEAIAENNRGYAQRQLLVDVSVLIHQDLKSGIERVVRSVLLQLLADSPPGYRVETVYRSGGFYRYARKFTEGLLGLESPLLKDTPVEASPGDIFLGLDFDSDIDEFARGWLRHHAVRGVKVYFVIHDLLPLFMPECFPSAMHASFKNWLEGIVSLADGVICVSKTTCDAVGKWLTLHPIMRIKPLQINYVHNGADIESSLPTDGISAAEKALLALSARHISILMVGTIEPRKGHWQAIEGFEELWKAGEEVVLVIVGKEGWMTGDLIKHLRSHPEKGKHLFWLEKASDELLLQLYACTSALLMASFGEGFGLPLIEAARQGLPIIARDIPVFREVAGDHAFYFKGTDSHTLAEALKSWTGLYKKHEHPTSEGLHWSSWEESTRQLKRVLFQSQPMASWDPQNGYHWNTQISQQMPASVNM